MLPPAVQEYSARLRDRRATRDALTAADARFALATFTAGALLAALAWYSLVTFWLLLAPLAAFLWLAHGHVRALRAREVASRGIEFYERGVARLEDRWAGTGEPGERFRDDCHVYANDLDLFGRGSLFELLSLARTRAGEAMLAGWLTAPADPCEVEARQAAVEELASALDLQEQLAVSGADVRAGVQTDRLLDWAESPMPPRQTLGGVVWFFTALTAVAILYLALASVWWPLLAVMLVHTVALRAFRDEINAILSAREPGTDAAFVADALTHRARDLDDVLAGILTHLEGSRLGGRRLAQLHSRLAGEGLRASHVVRRLHRLSELQDSLTNMAVLPLALFLAGAYTGQNWMLGGALALSALMLLLRPHRGATPSR